MLLLSVPSILSFTRSTNFKSGLLTGGNDVLVYVKYIRYGDLLFYLDFLKATFYFQLVSEKFSKFTQLLPSSKMGCIKGMI
jgi:hypothetical protein